MRRFWVVAFCWMALAVTVDAIAQTRTLRYNDSKTKTVCATGCQYTVICGAACATSTSDCAAGSAIQSIITAADFSPTNPYRVIVRPGTYNECVAFNDVTDVSLFIEEGARIVPTVDSYEDVEGGVIRIATGTATSVDRISIFSKGYVRNDAMSSPESALTIGPEVCNATPNTQDITVVGGTWIGNHDGIHVCGDASNSATDTDIPRVSIQDVDVVSGADGIVKKSATHLTVRNARVRVMTNYCETATADITDAESGTVDATGASTTTFTLDADANATVDAYTGRHGKLTGGTCAAGIDFWVLDSTAARLVTTTALGLTPDATCTYTIDPVVNATEAPCTEVDWTAIRGTQPDPFGYWKATGFHFGFRSVPQSTAPDRDYTLVQDSIFEVEVNDFGPDDGTTACATQQHIAGILAYTNSDFQKAIFENVTIRVTNNTVMRSSTAQSDNLCATPLAGFSVPVTDFDEFISFSGRIRVENTADVGAETYGIVATSTNGATTVLVPQAHVEVSNSVGAYAGTTATIIQGNSATLNVGKITSDAAVTISGTVTSMPGGYGIFPDRLVGRVGNLVAATCTQGEIALDNVTTKEICVCDAGAWACASATTATGPTD